MPTPTSSSLAAVLDHVDANLAASRDTLFDLLRIPSVSAQPAHAADCQRAAEWWSDQLAGLGFDASVRLTAGHPVVVGHLAGPPDYQGPHILFYGHYDVQPVDPVALWHSPIRSIRNTSTVHAWQALCRPWRGGRQRPDADVPGSVTGMAYRRRRHSQRASPC